MTFEHDFLTEHELINIKLENLVQQKVTDTFSLYAFSNINACELTTKIIKLKNSFPDIDLSQLPQFVKLRYSHTLVHMLQKEILALFAQKRYEDARKVFYGKYQEIYQELSEAIKDCASLIKGANDGLTSE